MQAGKVFGRVLTAAVVLAGFAPAVSAQERPISSEIFVGTRVRVFAPDLRSDRYIGRIDSLDATTMVLDTAGARIRLGLDMGPVLVDQYRKVAIRLNAIERIEVSGGRTARGATLRGAFVGALVGGLIWGLGNLPEINPSASDFVAAFPAGAAIGGVIGGAVGFGLGGEKWLPARLPR
jgi:hypothetical protein